MRISNQNNLRRTTVLLAAIFAAASLCAVTGCRKPVFGSAEDRSQFDRFDTSRDEHAEPFLEDEYGRKIPNLRGRLVR